MPWLRLIKRVSVPALFFLFFSIFIIACTKDPNDIGDTLTPDKDKLITVKTDTVTIWVFTELSDSIITNKTEYSLAGSYMDPVFGQATAGFATQFELSKVNPDFGPNPKLDSMILTLDYAGYYGDTTTLQTFRVYEVSEMMSSDSSYYSYDRVEHKPSPVGQITFQPHPTDSVMVDTIKQAAQLRISLSQVSHELGQRLLDAPEDVYGSNDDFKAFFKGLVVQAVPVSYKGAILYFDVQSLSSITKISLFYHNDTVDSLSFNLNVFPATTARFNFFEHNNYGQASHDLRKQVIFGDTAAGQELTYLQSMGGLRAKIRFPHLSKWKDAEKIAINEALLIIPCEGPGDLPPPNQLYLKRITPDGGLTTLVDESEGGSSYFGGTYQSAHKEYGYRLNRYVQEIVQGKASNDGLALLVTGAAVRANRLVIHGPAHKAIPMQLRITYSYSP
jgi:hypothetical protein